MYTEARQKELNNLTEKLLEKTEQSKLSKEEIDNLRNVLRFHEYRYYVLADPIIADVEYDKLFKGLQSLEKKYPELRSEDSPTQRMPEGLTKDFPEVEHLVGMLSLDNSYDEEDLVDFDRRVKELTGLDKIEYFVEPKFDGAGISVIYEDDQFSRGASRGNGAVGEDITNNLKTLRSLPLKPVFSELGAHKVELRGEVLIGKEQFKKLNEQRMEEGKSPFANPRNSAAGSLRLQDPKILAERNMEAFIYDISFAQDKDGNNLLTSEFGKRKDNINKLHKLGFKVPAREHLKTKSIKEVLQFCEEWEEKRDSYAYEIDGMVIKVNDLELQDDLGNTAHHPRWAMAYKFKARQSSSKLEEVIFQVGRVGTITPVAKIKPVNIGGATVSSVSLFNEDFIKEKDLRIGDKVLVERAGDVIPYIVKSQGDARTGDEKEINYPEKCPSCNTKLVRPEGEAAWICTNANCKAQVLERMIHFVSKDAMDIDGLGESLVKKFYNEGFLNKIPQIYSLDFGSIRKMEGFGEKSVDNLSNAIEKSKENKLAQLIFGLGIRFVGKTTARLLAKRVDNIWELKDYNQEDLLKIRDIGPKVAQSINDFFENESNLELIKELEERGINIKSADEDQQKSNTLEGKTFVFTGALENFTRDSSKEAVSKHGASVTGSVSKNTDYLIVGDKPGSKYDKAKKLGSVEILDEQGFIGLLKELE